MADLDLLMVDCKGPRREFLRWLSQACVQRPGAIVVLALLTSVCSAVVAWRGLALDMDRTALLETRASYHREYRAFRDEFATDDEVVLVVSGTAREQVHRVVTRLGGLLRERPACFETVIDRLDLGFVARHALLFATPAALQRLAAQLEALQAPLRELLTRPGLGPLFMGADRTVRASFSRAAGEPQAAEAVGAEHARPRRILTSRHHVERGAGFETLGAVLRLLSMVLEDMADSLDGKPPVSPRLYQLVTSRQVTGNVSPAATSSPRATYLEARDGTCLVLARPRSDAAVEEARHILHTVQGEFPEVAIAITGRPVIEYDETRRSSDDCSRATLISLVGVALLFLVAFRNMTHPLAAIGCLMMSLSWTLCLVTVTVGHLNPLTASAFPMLVGLGIDFGIQVICRYQEERAAGAGPSVAVCTTLDTTGASIVTAALITAVSFSVTGISTFRGIRELAWLAGGGIILSTVAMLIVLPSCIILCERTGFATSAGTSALRPGVWNALTRMERGILTHTLGYTLLWVVTLAVVLPQIRNLRYDSNLLHLQAQDMPSVKCERKLREAFGNSVLSAAVVVGDVEQARELEKRLVALPPVSGVMSVLPFIPSGQEDKLPLIDRIRATSSQWPETDGTAPAIDVEALSKAIDSLRTCALAACPELTEACGPAIRPDLVSFVAATDAVLAKVRRQGADASSRSLQRYQARLFRWIREQVELLHCPVEPVTVASLPQQLRTGLVSSKGRLLLRVLPRGDIWEASAMDEFLSAVRHVAPGATGSAVEIHESTLLVERDYARMALWSAVGVLALVLVYFRSLGAAILVLAPQVLGMLSMLGVQGLSGLALSPGNLLALSLLQGVAVANGIYIVRRFQETGNPEMLGCSTGKAILLSNLAALIGFASLLVSSHAGLWGFGMLMSVGLACCMTVSLLLLPTLLQGVASRTEPARRSTCSRGIP